MPNANLACNCAHRLRGPSSPQVPLLVFELRVRAFSISIEEPGTLLLEKGLHHQDTKAKHHQEGKNKENEERFRKTKKHSS